MRNGVVHVLHLAACTADSRPAYMSCVRVPRSGPPKMVTADEEPVKNAGSALVADTTASSAGDESKSAPAVPASLSKLRPAFKRDGGTVTAGNASTLRCVCATLSPVWCHHLTCTHAGPHGTLPPATAAMVRLPSCWSAARTRQPTACRSLLSSAASTMRLRCALQCVTAPRDTWLQWLVITSRRALQ